jgi:hypothetical protein
MGSIETGRIAPPTRETLEGLWNDEVPVTQIAEQYGVSRRRVMGWAYAYKLKPRPWVTPDPHRSGRMAELKRMWKNPAVTIVEIARRFESSSSRVRRWGLDYNLGPKVVPDEDGPLPGDPSPQEIAARAAAIKRAHICDKMLEPPDFGIDPLGDDDDE